MASVNPIVISEPTVVPGQDAVINPQNVRILLVDDSPTIHAKYRPLLEKQGYAVESAKSVAQALMMMVGNTFDIAIIDYYMPEANGDVLCRMLREHEHTANIVSAIFTAANKEDVVLAVLQAGATECLFKNEPTELFLTRVAAMSRTVVARKTVEAERLRLNSILASVGEGVYGVDGQGRVDFVNPSALRILGYSDAKEILGRSPHEAIHPSSILAGEPHPLKHAYEQGTELYNIDTIFRSVGGTPVAVECTVRPLKIGDRIHGSVVAFGDITERKIIQEKLHWQATRDALTSLHNRHYFEQQLTNEVHRIQRIGSSSALLYLDLDQFKYVNDTAGHAAGDHLLVEVSQHLLQRIRRADIVARLGGDEFAMILRDADGEEAMKVAETFRQMLQDFNFVHAGRSFNINGSIGIAMITKQTTGPQEVLANADIACHLAKNRGRNIVHFYQPEDQDKKTMALELGWANRLQQALESDRFQLSFQPIIPVALSNVATAAESQTEHYEVLVRYIGDDGEPVVPSVFIPIAERFGVMHAIDRWVINRSIHQLAALRQAGRNINFSLNLSGKAFEDEGLLDFIRNCIQSSKVDTSALTFEVTETAAITSLDEASNFITSLKQLGCSFSLDDFGSGFSSFGHLKYLPVDYVKIDGTFVRDMVSDPVDHAMVRAMNDIAHVLGKRTIAEFVENFAILGLLRKIGVDFAQGHYIGMPRPRLDLG